MRWKWNKFWTSFVYGLFFGLGLMYHDQIFAFFGYH